MMGNLLELVEQSLTCELKSAEIFVAFFFSFGRLAAIFRCALQTQSGAMKSFHTMDRRIHRPQDEALSLLSIARLRARD